MCSTLAESLAEMVTMVPCGADGGDIFQADQRHFVASMAFSKAFITRHRCHKDVSNVIKQDKLCRLKCSLCNDTHFDNIYYCFHREV